MHRVGEPTRPRELSVTELSPGVVEVSLVDAYQEVSLVDAYLLSLRETG